VKQQLRVGLGMANPRQCTAANAAQIASGYHTGGCRLRPPPGYSHGATNVATSCPTALSVAGGGEE